MGTNYYVTVDKCECCGRGSEELHIGKSSYGWRFTFEEQPAHGLTSFAAWMEFLRQRPEAIRDEYDRPHTPEAFAALVNAKQRDGKHDTHGRLDDDGYFFSQFRDFS
jgi:hypothetical protein